MSAPARRPRQRPARPGVLAQARTALHQWLERPLTSLHLVLAVFGLLTALGLVMVLSASAVSAYAAGGSSYGVFFRQSVFAMIGLVLFWIGLRVPPRHLRAASPWLLAGCLVLLVLVLVPGLGADGQRLAQLVPRRGALAAALGAHEDRAGAVGRARPRPPPPAPADLARGAAAVAAGRAAGARARARPARPRHDDLAHDHRLRPAVVRVRAAGADGVHRLERRRGLGGARRRRHLPAEPDHRVPQPGHGRPARPGLPGAPGAVLARRRRPVRRGPRAGAGEVGLPAQRRQRLHLRDHRRGAGVRRGGRGDRPVRHARLRRAADRRAQRRPVDPRRRRRRSPSGWWRRPASTSATSSGCCRSPASRCPWCPRAARRWRSRCSSGGLLANFARHEPEAAAALRAHGQGRLARALRLPEPSLPRAAATDRPARRDRTPGEGAGERAPGRPRTMGA